LIKRGDCILILVCLAIALGVFVLRQTMAAQNPIAYLQAQNQPRQAIDLTNDQIFSAAPNVMIEVKNNRVRFVQSDCPDQICVHAGWISKAGDSVVCLPNQIAVVFESGEQSGVDGIAY
jgi:hypothetical protein